MSFRAAVKTFEAKGITLSSILEWGAKKSEHALKEAKNSRTLVNL